MHAWHAAFSLSVLTNKLMPISPSPVLGRLASLGLSECIMIALATQFIQINLFFRLGVSVLKIIGRID